MTRKAGIDPFMGSKTASLSRKTTKIPRNMARIRPSVRFAMALHYEKCTKLHIQSDD